MNRVTKFIHANQYVSVTFMQVMTRRYKINMVMLYDVCAINGYDVTRGRRMAHGAGRPKKFTARPCSCKFPFISVKHRRVHVQMSPRTVCLLYSDAATVSQVCKIMLGY